MTQLWYRQPAANWKQALPLGNGRLGAMVFGGIQEDQFQLNQDSIWSTGFRDRNNRDAYEQRAKIRRLMKAGRMAEAEQLTQFSQYGTPPTQAVYQTAGNLLVTMLDDMTGATAYRRELDLNTAIAGSTFQQNGTAFTREAFCSYPEQALIIHLTSDQAERLNFSVTLNHDAFLQDEVLVATGDPATLMTSGGGAIKYAAAVRVEQTGGTVAKIGGYLVVKGASEATIALTIATNFYDEAPEQAAQVRVEHALAQPYDVLKAAHVADHQSLYDRVALRLNGSSRDELPTDQRLVALRSGGEDLGLIQLYFDYSRYLMIAGSRPGSLPLTLQGIWNKDLAPEWGSKYTININTEMNYWTAESLNLAECHQPLFDHLARMYPHGQATARLMYHAGGWVAHHNTDIWGDTAPQDVYPPATLWCLGGAWLSLDIWQHYQYTQDQTFLQQNYYLLRDAVQFFADTLVENEQHQLIIFPSLSPENAYVDPVSGRATHLDAGVTMDHEILHDLFTAYLGAANVLGETADRALQTQTVAMLAKLPPLRIQDNKTFAEWSADYEETEPGHRHISHLFALYPSNQLNEQNDPKQLKAARRTLERRVKADGASRGWSLAWAMCAWARLGNGEAAATGLRRLLTVSTQDNLLNYWPIFQIEGNFGGAAAIKEMLIQSYPGHLVLLPALPVTWPSGRVSGIKAIGDVTVDLCWQAGQVTAVTLTTPQAQTLTVTVNGHDEQQQLQAGANVLTLTDTAINEAK